MCPHKHKTAYTQKDILFVDFQGSFPEKRSQKILLQHNENLDDIVNTHTHAQIHKSARTINLKFSKKYSAGGGIPHNLTFKYIQSNPYLPPHIFHFAAYLKINTLNIEMVFLREHWECIHPDACRDKHWMFKCFCPSRQKIQ